MDFETILRIAHVIGATVLLGTGAGIAFFMVMAKRSGDPAVIAHVASTVVIADTLFTLTAVIAQPITGALLADAVGWPLTTGWIVLALGLYVLTGLFWLPVVFIQIRLRNIAKEAVKAETPLPAQWHRLYAIWFACGFPAFAAVLGIVWLMIARPDLALI